MRNYAGPDGGGRFDLWKLKRWDEMFLTTDRAAVEAKCRAEGFEPHVDRRRRPAPGQHAADRAPRHPATGERVWHNHTHDLPPLRRAAASTARIYRAAPDAAQHWLLWQLARVLGRACSAAKPIDERGDALHLRRRHARSPTPTWKHVRDAVWRHLVVTPVAAAATSWRSTTTPSSHGRLPFQGPRQIAVAWA